MQAVEDRKQDVDLRQFMAGAIIRQRQNAAFAARNEADFRAARRRGQPAVPEIAQQPLTVAGDEDGQRVVRAGSSARMTLVAESTETSCSAERPP
jgi:hypothetical protein